MGKHINAVAERQSLEDIVTRLKWRMIAAARKDGFSEEELVAVKKIVFSSGPGAHESLARFKNLKPDEDLPKAIKKRGRPPIL
jgi:hypothetical protein